MAHKLTSAVLLCFYFFVGYYCTGETLFESHSIKAVNDPELVGLQASAKSKSISASSVILVKGSPTEQIAEDEFDSGDSDRPAFVPDCFDCHRRHRHRRTTTRRRPHRTTTTTRRTRRTTTTTRRIRTTPTPRADNVNNVNVQNNVKVRNSGGRSNENKINVGSNVDIQNDDEGVF